MKRNKIEEWVGFGISRRFVLFVLALVFGACSGGSCGNGCGGCGGFEERPYPPEFYPQTVQQSGQIRVTPTGLDFVEQNISTLLDSALPNGLDFCLSARTDSPEVCNDGSMCSTGVPGCDISLVIESAEINPTPPDTLAVDIAIGGLDETIPVTVEVFGAEIDCNVEPHLKGDENQPARVSATVPITFSVEQASPTGDVRIDVGELEPDLSELDFNLSGGFACTLGELASRINFIRNLILDQITGPLQDAVDDITRENLCLQCDPMGGCPSGSSCTTADNVCDFGSGECVPAPLGIEGRFLLGDALADFTEHPESALDLLLKVADRAQVNDGLTLGLRSGYQPDALRRCIPVDPTARPDYQTIPLSPAIVGNTKPDGTPFMFGAGYHKKAIEHALWSVWGSGATCLMLDSSFASQLNSGVFLALLSSLDGIVERGTNASLKIVPQEPPVVVLGNNEVMPSGDTYEIVDPLMTIDWKDLDLHIYLWSQDRNIRVARLRVDVVVPVAIVPDGMGNIVPVIGDLSTAVQNIRALDTEIASEDPQVLADLVPTLVGAALPSLAGDLVQPIEVPELFGLRLALTQDDITSVDESSMIAIYANLEAASMPLVSAPDFGIADTRVDYTNVLDSGVVRPEVVLDMVRLDQQLGLERMTSEPDDGLEIEYSYRIDDGWWSLYHRREELRIEHPVLTAPGAHRIEVRARYRGLDGTTTAPVSTDVWIDWDKPVIDGVDRDGERLVVEAFDLAEPMESLEYRFRVVGEGVEASWNAWSNEPTLELTSDLPARVRVDIEVRDRVGNVGTHTQMVRRSALEASAPVGPTERASTAGCSSTGTSANAGVILLFVILFLGLRRRRRWRFAQVALLASLLSFSGCSCDDEETANPCGEECPTGTYCDGESCVPGCDEDSDCLESERCVENQCVTDCEATCDASCGDGEFGVCDESGACTCEPYCGGACEEGSYCCEADNACQSLPDPCSDQVCDPGFEPSVVMAATGDPSSCEVTAGSCECVSLPPLELGLIGPYLDLDSNAGVTAVTAYNATYEDFMLGILEGEELTWTFVDGVPADGMIGGALDGPRAGISSDGEEVGTHTALVIDDAGTFHMFYRDIENSTMKYARATGAPGSLDVEIQEIDATPGTGFWTDAILHDGEIHVVWLVDNFNDGGSFVSQVRTATLDPSAATVELMPETLFSGRSSHPCGDSCERSDACVQATGECVTATNDCPNACGDAQVCYMGSCEIEYTPGRISRLTTTGQHLELSETPDGLLLTFYDHEQRSAGWTRYTDSWAMPQFVGTPSGPYATGFVDASDKLHLAYMDTQAKTVVYQNVTDGITETVIEGVRDLADMWLITDIGEDVTMRVDADGTVVMVFQDATLHTLHLAERATDGTWTVNELAGRDPYMGSHGFFATLQKVADTSLVAHWSINQQVDPRVAVPVILQP